MDPHLKVMGPIYGSHRIIGLLYISLDPERGGYSSKVAPSVWKQPLSQPIHNKHEAIVNVGQYAMREHMNVTLGQIIVVDQSIASNAQLMTSQQKVVIYFSNVKKHQLYGFLHVFIIGECIFIIMWG